MKKHQYLVYPSDTINLPEMIKEDVMFLNYEGYLPNNLFVDVRTRIVHGEQEIVLAQIVDNKGKFIRQLSPDDIKLADYAPREQEPIDFGFWIYEG